METMKRNWVSPVSGVQRFVPQYCQSPCETSISIVDSTTPGYSYSWMIRDVSPTGLIEGSDDSGRSGYLVPAPANVTYIHEMFGLSSTASAPYNYTTKSYLDGLYTLTDSDNNGRINTGDFLNVIVDGKTYKCYLDGSSAASYANPKAKYYKYVKNNS